MTGSFQSLAHAKWACKSPVVLMPTRRRKAVFGHMRTHLGGIFHERARQKECQIIEGHLMPDHAPLCIALPQKSAVASVRGFLKGKAAIAIARQFAGRARNYTGAHFWARRYCGSTVGYEEDKVRAYIRAQAGSDDEGRF